MFLKLVHVNVKYVNIYSVFLLSSFLFLVGVGVEGDAMGLHKRNTNFIGFMCSSVACGVDVPTISILTVG